MELPKFELQPRIDDVERIAYLYRQVPPMVASALIGIFLVFLFLFEAADGQTLKAWTAYMLSILAMRSWLWFTHRNADITPENVRRWELAAAFGALLTGLGWGALGGPLAAGSNHGAGDFIVLILVGVAFSSVTFNSLSLASFFGVVLPTIAAIAHHVAKEGGGWVSGPNLAVIVLLGVLLTLQRSQFNAVMDNLSRRVESEALLAEQQAIFQSTSQGIAVVDGRHIVKSNQRLGEMLGRRLQDLYSLGLAEHFPDHAEYERTTHEAQQAFNRGHSFHGVVRMRRADGSDFWAELSCRRMSGDNSSRSVWLIGDVPAGHGGHARTRS